MEKVEIKGKLSLQSKRVLEKAEKIDELFVGHPESTDDLLTGFLEFEIACFLVQDKYSQKLDFSIQDFLIQILEHSYEIVKPIREQYERGKADETEQRERVDILGSSAECVPGS